MSYLNLPASGAGGPSKLPIPRLHKQRSEPPRKPVVHRQNRVSRACLSCRSRKIKCNGLQPRCSNCSDNQTACVYASSRKDRLKTATSHNQDMIALLRELRPQVSNDRQIRIDDLLASVVEDVADAVATVGDPTDKYRGPFGDEDQSEANASADVTSSAGGEQDQGDEDLARNEDIRPAGLAGKVPEIQWLRRLHSADTSSTYHGGPWGLPGDDEEAALGGRLDAHRQRHNALVISPAPPVDKASFYLDDKVLETDLLVDPFEMPALDMAEELVYAYMECAQLSFPFLAKNNFLDKFNHYYASLQRGTPYNVSREWQATLNVVFAIGAVYSHRTNGHVDSRDHLMYHSRAWSLTLRDPWWFSYPDPTYMQITGLLSFYYLSTGHINRSWALIGSAVRSGYALGMHLSNEDGTTSPARREVNSRVWWAHYSFEQLVSILTGRPSSGMGYLCSIPLPSPLDSEDTDRSTIDSRSGDKGKRPLILQRPLIHSQTEDITARQNLDYYNTAPGPADSSSYLRSVVSLGEITQAALELYRANTMSTAWTSLQISIAQHSDELDAWARALPTGLNFLHKLAIIESPHAREQNTLEMLYYSAKILITRPCLCRLDRGLSAQTAALDTFSRRAALVCIGAAKTVASLLPDAFVENLVTLYQTGPWWQMVHVIMQAFTVLCLEVALDGTPNDRQALLSSLKKLLQWLRVMRGTNTMAVRAYSISLMLLNKVTSTININISEILGDQDEIMTTPAERSPTVPTLAQTHTPYPNVLNPVDEPPTSKKRPSASAPAPTLQYRKYALEASRSQHPSDPSPYQRRSSQPSESLHLPPIYTNDNLVSKMDATFPASTGLEQVTFPGWIVTSFDECNLFSANVASVTS